MALLVIMFRECSGDSALTLMEGKTEGNKCKKDVCELMTLKVGQNCTVLNEKIKRLDEDRMKWRAVARQLA